jgi:hypothetical protein
VVAWRLMGRSRIQRLGYVLAAFALLLAILTAVRAATGHPHDATYEGMSAIGWMLIAFVALRRPQRRRR